MDKPANFGSSNVQVQALIAESTTLVPQSQLPPEVVNAIKWWIIKLDWPCIVVKENGPTLLPLVEF